MSGAGQQGVDGAPDATSTVYDPFALQHNASVIAYWCARARARAVWRLS